MLTTAAMTALRLIDPETAHGLALRALSAGVMRDDRRQDNARLGVSVLGRRFTNPIGLAAGFDKNAAAGANLFRLGFGFVETGTVTPLPQAGNARPRIFRLSQDRGVINRLGFNNDGLAVYLRNLAKLSGRPAPLGANVGINRSGADPVRDYPALIKAVAPLVDYAVINVSSPNTPGLRDLQSEAQLRAILDAVAAIDDRPPCPGENLPRPVAGGLAGSRGNLRRCRREGPDRRQHHHLPPARAAFGPCQPSGRTVRGAAARPVARQPGAHLPAGARTPDADRRGRHLHRPGHPRQDPGRRVARAALHQLRLSRARR